MSSPEIKLCVQIRIPNFEIRISLYPCRCLCLGFLQMTRTTPFRRTILQLSHNRFTDARTFMVFYSSNLFVSIRDTSLREIIRRNLHGHSITNQYLDEIHPHLPRDVSKNLVAIIKLHFERCIGQSFRNHSIDFDWLLFCHLEELWTTLSRSLLCPSSRQWCVRSVPKVCHLMS
jgi:hypothetical protein